MHHTQFYLDNYLIKRLTTDAIFLVCLNCDLAVLRFDILEYKTGFITDIFVGNNKVKLEPHYI